MIKKKAKLEKMLLQVTDCIRGSINSVCANCKRAECVCLSSTRLRIHRLTYKDSNQKTKIVYIPREKLGEMKRRIKNYANLKKILEQLQETNIEIFRNGE